MRVLGMISGTSFDAIDVAVAELDRDGGTVRMRPVHAQELPFPEDLRHRVAALLPPAPTTIDEVCRLDTLLGQAFADAAEAAIATAGPVDVVVSHGQTVFHWAEDRHALGTLQLGQPAWIAARTGAAVVSDLRSRDIAEGGHGAPLASTLDVLLLGEDRAEVCGSLNLGGIANLTVVGGRTPPIAYDTGPANAFLDAAVRELTGGAEHFDAGGARAARGTVDTELLGRLLADPYYDLAPPKSTGKELFHLAALTEVLGGRPIDDDVLATLVELTVETVARACEQHGVTEVFGAGGGMSNPFLRQRLAARLGSVPLRDFDELGIPAATKEAYLFALLGFLTVHGLPGTVPSCTGARSTTIAGTVVPGRGGLPRPTGQEGGRVHRLEVVGP